ncbi:glycosyltransferase family protein [Paenibacillus flagellatus]|uniref:Spore protein YkvP/CgeB glycosyl transferase-like domain-containing protein n=1 Tax=Paenibacillus flagellatus TaxID=2211139 RepID=A0A2V5K2Z5_9BACL|nr:glycosyltransferase [Paenibacillus flagellatus]PYI53561.1 hypothetical protein DLM86_17530 [Paenibacillus flagellatus]
MSKRTVIYADTEPYSGDGEAGGGLLLTIPPGRVPAGPLLSCKLRAFVVARPDDRSASAPACRVEAGEPGSNRWIRASCLREAGGDLSFAEWDLTPFIESSGSLPSRLRLDVPAGFEIWGRDERYDYFAPRIETIIRSGGGDGNGVSDRWRRSLAAICEAADAKGVVLYPPTIDWHTPLFQRPHQLALAFAKAGYLVFFMTPNEAETFGEGFHAVRDRLYVANVPVETFDIVERPIVLLTWTMSLNRLTGLTDPFLLYEYIDELPIFTGYDRRMEIAHRYLLRHAGLVTATASSLWEKAVRDRPDALLSYNAVDYERFAAVETRQGPVPDDMRETVDSGRSVVGYYGAIAKWLDYGLLRHAAEHNPDFDFVLIGPDYDGSMRRAGLERFSNIRYLGAKRHDELPSYLAYFDAAIIPFRLNSLTVSTSPLKLFEYLAAGKAVVSTPIPECAKCEPVLTARHAKTFAESVRLAVRLGRDPQYVRTARRFAARHTWEQRVRDMDAAMDARRQAAR